MSLRLRHFVASIGALALVATGVSYIVVSPVAAGTQTASLAISASVANNCTISTAPVAFGSYDPVVTHASANLDAAGTVTIACTKGSVTPVDLNLGSNASGSVRRMSDGGTNYLNYELYQDSGRTTVWGAGASGYTPVAATSKAGRDFTVFARVPSGQDVPAGSYGDSVTATVNF